MKATKLIVAACALLGVACSGVSRMEENTGEDSLWVLVGSYAPAEDEGVKVFSFNQSTASFDYVSGLKGISNPSYLAVSERGERVYSVGEDDGRSSSANAIAFDRKSGGMKLLNSVPTQGGAPCYIRLSPDERWLLTANYMGANISVIGVDSLGLLTGNATTINFQGKGVHPERQEQPHLHCVEFTPDGNQLLANDLGLDCIHRFRVNAEAERAEDYLQLVEDVKVEPESGPRHVVFGNNVRNAYLINEISGCVTVFDLDSTLVAKQYAVADSIGAQGSGDIHISPDGRHLYASNRLQADGIAIFSIGADGLLTHIGYQDTGRHPRNFAITPNGQYVLVACRDENAIEIYLRDEETGLLTDSGLCIETPKPVCIKFISR